MRAATLQITATVALHIVSIRAAREGGDGAEESAFGVFDVSIRAAREGGDGPPVALAPAGMSITPPAP